MLKSSRSHLGDLTSARDAAFCRRGRRSGFVTLRRASYLLLFALASGSFLHAAPCVPPDAMKPRLLANPDAATLNELGIWFAGKEQYACSANAFAASLQKEPTQQDMPNVVFMFGASLYLSGEIKEAVAALQEAERLSVRNIRLNLILAAAFDSLHSTSDAETNWRAALAIDPFSSAAYDGLSSDLVLDGNFAEIITLLEKPSILSQRTPVQSLNLGLAYARTSRLEEAARVLRDGLNTSPDSLPVANELADVLTQLGRGQEAVTVLDLALEQHPEDTDTGIHLVETLMTAAPERALETTQKLLLASPQNWNLLYLNGVLEMKSGNLQQARAHLEQSESLKADFASSHEALGVVLAQLKDMPGAQAQFEKAIALGDTNPEVRQNLSNVLKTLGKEN